MNTSDVEKPDLIRAAWCTDRELIVSLVDERRISVPLWWYPRLLSATPAQRRSLQIGRYGIHWEELDEDIELAALLLGAKAPGALPPTRPSYAAEH